MKEIVTQELQLDPKRFDPKKTRWAISNAKNQGGCRTSSRRMLKASGASSLLMSTGVIVKLWRQTMPWI